MIRLSGLRDEALTVRELERCLAMVTDKEMVVKIEIEDGGEDSLVKRLEWPVCCIADGPESYLVISDRLCPRVSM